MPYRTEYKNISGEKRPIKEEHWDDYYDELISTIKFYYNKKGQLIKRKSFFENTDKVEFKDMYEFDELQNKIKHSYYHHKTGLCWTLFFKYKDGKLREKIQYNRLGELSYIIKYYYDIYGVKMKEEEYDSKEKLKITRLYKHNNILARTIKV